MQPITWTTEEFQASVQRKLARLRAMAPSDGRTLDQRLALANDRIAFEEEYGLARQRHAAKSGAQWAVGGPPLMERFADESMDECRERPAQPARGFTAADDSYGARGAQPSSFTPPCSVSGGQELPAFLSETDAAAVLSERKSKSTQYDPDKLTVAEMDARRHRLFEENARLSSNSWVVLDRGRVLQFLAAYPKGLTLVQLGTALLGVAANPRDTRRLSAMMKREESRQTVSRSGRGQPILLNDVGKEALADMDVNAQSERMTEIRAKRVYSQRLRLLGLQPAPSHKATPLP